MSNEMKFCGYEYHVIFEEIGNLSNCLSVSGHHVRDVSGTILGIEPIVQLGERAALQTGKTTHGKLALWLSGNDLEAAHLTFKRFRELALGEMPFAGGVDGYELIRNSGDNFEFTLHARSDTPMPSEKLKPMKAVRVSNYQAFANNLVIGLGSNDSPKATVDLSLYTGTYSGLCLAFDFELVMALKQGMTDEQIREKFIPLRKEIEAREVEIEFRRVGGEVVLHETFKLPRGKVLPWKAQ